MSTSKKNGNHVSESEEEVLSKLRAALENEPNEKNKKSSVQDKEIEDAILSALASVSDGTDKPNVDESESTDDVSFDDIFGAAFAEDGPIAELSTVPTIEQVKEPEPEACIESAVVSTEVPLTESDNDIELEVANEPEPESDSDIELEVVNEPATESGGVVELAVGEEPITEYNDEPVAEAVDELATENAVPMTEPIKEESQDIDDEPIESSAAQSVPEIDQPLEAFNLYLASLLDSLPMEGQPYLPTEEEAFSALKEEDVVPTEEAANGQEPAQSDSFQTTVEPSVTETPVSKETGSKETVSEPVSDAELHEVSTVSENRTPHVKWVGTVIEEPVPAPAVAEPVQTPPVESTKQNETDESITSEKRESMSARRVAEIIAANLRQREEETNRAERDSISEQSLSDDDMKLMLHLGYEAELARVIGYSPIERMKRGSDEDPSVWPPVDEQYNGMEYDMSSPEVERISRKKIKHRIHISQFFNVLRVTVVLLLAFFMLYYDLTPKMHLSFLSFLDSTEKYTAFGAFVLLIAVLLSGRTIMRGIKRLVSLRPNSVSVPIVVCLSLFLYDTAAILSGDPDVLQLNSVGVIGMLAVAVRDFMCKAAEKAAFSVISSKDVKFAVEPLYEKMAGPNQNTNKGRQRMMWLARPVKTIRHFRARFHEAEPYERSLPFMLPLALLLSLAAGLFGLLCDKSLFVAYSWMEITFLCLLPSFVTIQLAYPWMESERRLAKHKCAMIGRNAPYFYVGPSMLLFPDSVALEARNSTEMHVKNVGDTTLYISRLRRLFDEAGGTLTGILGKSPIAPTAERVQITAVDVWGLTADFDGAGTSDGKTVHAVVGTWKFMQAHGINALTEDDARIKRNRKDTGLLYAAFDGELKLIFEVEYGVFAGFLGAVPGLTEYDIATGLYTEDPVLNDAFVGKCLSEIDPNGLRSVPINVLKPKRHRELPLPEETASGLIACGSASQVAHGLVAAAGLRQIYRIGTLMRWIAMIVGGFLSLDMMLSGVGKMPALRLILLQIIWVIPIWAITRIYLIRKDKDMKNGKGNAVAPQRGNGSRRRNKRK